MSRGPAKSADVPHFSKMLLFFFSLPIILHVCVATQQSDELRIKIGKDRSVQNSHADRPLIINTLYYRSVRQMPSLLHARQPSPTTVYFFNAATPASSINTATVVFTAHSSTTPHTVLLLSDCCECELHVYIYRSFSCFISRQTCSSLNMLYRI